MTKIPTLSPRFVALLKDISSFERRFRRALSDGRRLDRVRGFGGPSNPYDDFAPILGRLFERARQAFDQGKMELARDAYAALFFLLALKDDYGFAITRPECLVTLKTEVLPRAETVLKSAEARYTAGDTSLGEVLPARRDWAAAQLTYLESLRDVMQAWAALTPYVAKK